MTQNNVINTIPGQAATKNVTDNTKASVASISGSFTTGHVVVAADTSGTASDGGLFFNSINIQTFTSNGTYTPTANMLYCQVICTGSGGGAGGSQGGVSGSAAASGGCSGGTAIKYFSAATIGVSQTVTIGAGGAGGSAGNNNGSAGNTTSFGALISATGGGAGLGKANSTAAVSVTTVGTPGNGSSGSVNLLGGYGNYGLTFGSVPEGLSGFGGTSYLGAGPAGFSTSGSDGATATNPGAGGSGAFSLTVDKAGGSGAAGMIIVYEYIG